MEPEAAFKLGHRPALDGFRGVAVLLVLIGHSHIVRVARAGTTGVTLFFVLSGFLITLLLLEEHDRSGAVSLRRFYVRRALRLFPAMALTLTVVGVYAAVAREALAPVAFSALYVANIAAASGRDLGMLSHMWSLSMEEQFYVVWPGLLLLSLRGGRSRAIRVALLGVVLSLGLSLFFIATRQEDEWWRRVNYGPDTRCYGLFFGCLAALWLPRLLRARWIRFLVVPALLACAVASQASWSASFYLVELPLAAVGGVIVLVALLDGDSALGRAASWPVLTYMGRISYGIYLWHFPIFRILRLYLRGVPFLAGAAVLVVVSVAVAATSYAVLEAPVLRLKDRFRAPEVARARADEAVGPA